MLENGVRIPKQLRSKESLERLLNAGIEVLRDAGYEGLSIVDVGALAGVSVGSIYARFKSKDALFEALQIRMLSKIDEEQADLFRDMTTEHMSDATILREVIRRVADHVRRHDAVLRVMILRGAVDEATRMRGSASSLRLAQHVETTLLSQIKCFATSDPQLSVDVAFRMLYATLTRRLVSGPSFGTPRHIGWDTLVTEITRALSAYLIGSAALE